jgi:hypothetical protein
MLKWPQHFLEMLELSGSCSLTYKGLTQRRKGAGDKLERRAVPQLVGREIVRFRPYARVQAGRYSGEVPPGWQKHPKKLKPS